MTKQMHETTGNYIRGFQLDNTAEHNAPEFTHVRLQSTRPNAEQFIGQVHPGLST